jgi:phage repressor protein C with HTH and peptisase S24 domain
MTSLPKYAPMGRRVAQIRATEGMKQGEFAKKIGISRPALSAIENGITRISVPLAYAISYLFGYNHVWILTGDGNMKDANVSIQTTVKPDFPADDFVLIRQVNGKISAGNGFLPDDSVDIQAAFRKDWIKRKGGKPDRMSLIKVDGDSMEPTLLSGDLVLVDHSRDTIASQGGIYAIAIDDEIMIKRVQPVFPDGKLRVISDNKQYDPFEIETGRVRVNGKVIWYARELER